MHINAVRHAGFSHLQLDVGFILLKMDHLPVLASPVRFCGAAHIDGLKDVGLSLGIVTV